MKGRQERAGEWSDAKKWWLDLVKFAITFGLGAVVTYLVINSLDDRRLERRYLAEKRFELRLSAADQFRGSSLNYHDAAQDAYLELARTSLSNSFDRTAPVVRYEDQAWVEYQASIERVRERFSDDPVHACLSRLDQQNRQRHGVYQEAWIGWINGRNPAKRWEAGSRRRPDYDRLLAAFLEQRTECLRLLEAGLSQGLPR